MAQNTVDFSTDMTGKVLLDTRLTPMQENILTSNSGTTTPVYAKKGTVWLNDGNGKLNVFDGTNNDPLLYEKTGVPMWDVNLATRYEQNAVVGYLKDGNYTFYRNLTGAGTTTPPDEDAVNWAKLDFGDFANKDLSNLTSTGLDAFAQKDLSNVPAEYDYVVESGSSTEGNQTAHYKLFKSGFLIQWGLVDYGGTQGFKAVTFNKPFSSIPIVLGTWTGSTAGTSATVSQLQGAQTVETTYFTTYVDVNVPYRSWIAIGQGATE